MEPKNYEGIYIVDAEWLANHRKEHYDIEGDEVTFSTLPYVTFEDIYEDAEHINIPLDHLREMCDAERDGRLLVLPCKVGDTVYYPFAGRVIEKRVSKYTEILRKSECVDKWYCVEFSDDETFDEEDVGKTVFLTRAEAEAALQKEAQHE